MSHPIDPHKLLRQARALAGFQAGRGRPSPTNHRRAVSAAYYALFHAISLASIRHVLPTTAADEEIRQGARWINHKDIRQVCDVVTTCAAFPGPIAGMPKGLAARSSSLWLALSAPHGPSDRVSVVPGELRFVAEAFVTLQTVRHSADYDHLAAFPKSRALGHVEEADAAVTHIDRHEDDDHFQRFFAWVVARASSFAA